MVEIYNKKILLEKISQFNFTTRLNNYFQNNDIFYIGDLIIKSEDEIIKNPLIGKKSLNEIKEVLKTMNLSLGMKLDDWTEQNIKIWHEELYHYPNLIDDFWIIFKEHITKVVVLKHLRKINLEDHQKIINNYCKTSKSPYKNRNIHIYDSVILQKLPMSNVKKTYKLSQVQNIINSIIEKGFDKDLLKYWDIRKYEDNSGRAIYEFKK
tara:strand:- start:1856 stop:2482 length:627 start_codon:yes stop_codon:yes gene_type:complete